MTDLEAKDTMDHEKSRNSFDSATWRWCLKRELRKFNARAKRTLKKLEGEK